MRPTPRLLILALAILALTGVLAATAGGAIKRTDGTYIHDTALSQPTTTQPATGQVLSYPTDPIKLGWRPVPGAAKYEVQVARAASTTADCTATAAFTADNIMLTHPTTELGWVPELVDADTGSGIWTGTFCWRVRATGAKVPGVWSSGSRFTLTWTAQATNLKFFSDEAGDIPRAAGTAGEAQGFDTGYLEWDPVSGATQYEVQISNSQTFSTASIFATKTFPATRLLLPQMPDNQYSWRVRPVTATGIKGSWSAIANFRIFHDDRYWGGSSNPSSNTLFPIDGATVDDIRIGWEPVPGASHYQFESISIPTTFSEIHNMEPYGGFSDVETCSGSVEGRISPLNAEDSVTINNWVSASGLFGIDVIDKLTTYCEWTDDNGTPSIDTDDTDYKVLPPLPTEFHWRVYPVWQLSSTTEQGWTVAATKILGKPVEREFTTVAYNPNTIAAQYRPVTAVRCGEGVISPNVLTPNLPCLKNMGGGMSPLNPSMDSTTMQVPVFEWGAYEGWTANQGPGSFRVQIAQDPQFDFMLGPVGQDPKRGWIANRGPAKRDSWASDSKGMLEFGGVTRSFALTTGLPDEGLVDGDGYFWRSIPCQSGSPDSLCVDAYKDETDWTHSPGIAFGVPNSGALQFHKRVEVSTAVINGFTPTTPMLRVGPVNASTFTEWQRGIQGADHYEFELARNQAFDEDQKVFKTTVPRIVPWGATPADVIAPGTWFWRVRAIDRDGLAGSWSNTSSFTATSPAPVISSSSATLGVGGTVEWSPVSGASGYQIAWSTDDGFASGVTTKDTKQTAYHIPATAAGALYWRVRAQTGATTFGQWSEERRITILSPSHIPFGVSANITRVGTVAIVEGQLVVAGTARNGQRVTLQRKDTSCEGNGTYRSYQTRTTGDNIDDGIVRFRVRVMQSHCYRLAWTYATGSLYSAAFELGAKPVVSFTPLQRRIARGRSFCSLIVSNTPVTGRLQVQYRVGRTWVTARTANVTRMRLRRQCAAINRGGSFPVRLYLDRMVHANGWQNLEPTAVGNGTVRTNDSFQIIRHGRG